MPLSHGMCGSSPQVDEPRIGVSGSDLLIVQTAAKDSDEDSDDNEPVDGLHTFKNDRGGSCARAPRTTVWHITSGVSRFLLTAYMKPSRAALTAPAPHTRDAAREARRHDDRRNRALKRAPRAREAIAPSSGLLLNVTDVSAEEDVAALRAHRRVRLGRRRGLGEPIDLRPGQTLHSCGHTDLPKTIDLRRQRQHTCSCLRVDTDLPTTTHCFHADCAGSDDTHTHAANEPADRSQYTKRSSARNQPN